MKVPNLTFSPTALDTNQGFLHGNHLNAIPHGMQTLRGTGDRLHIVASGAKNAGVRTLLRQGI